MKRTILFAVLLITVCSGFLLAQTQTAAAGGGLRADWHQQMDDVEKKILSLAEAVPAEKYTWRPAEGVRSIGEVYVHIAGGNYFLPSLAGVTPPPGFKPDAEKTVTDKAKIIELIKQSFVHVRGAFDKLPDSDMEKKINFFGEEMTLRGLYLTVLTHLHEHLGQSIAYARTNGVVPPWSAAESKPASK